jgi:hypothetical protein
LAAADICIVDFDGNRLEGEYPPSVEAGMHMAVYKNRLDVNAVIHSHQPKASALRPCSTNPFRPFLTRLPLIVGHVIDVIPYALSGSPELIADMWLQNYPTAAMVTLSKTTEPCVWELDLKKGLAECATAGKNRPGVPGRLIHGQGR